MMIDLNTPHGRLLGLEDRELRLLAGTATHQHFKGGLYRRVGPVIDTETGEQLKMPESGEIALLYEHVAPHATARYMRGEDDWNQLVEWEARIAPGPDRLRLNEIYGGYAFISRFRQLGSSWAG